ncbi:MAG: isomerase/hydrolase [Acidobacteria bacterium CG_4_9_14_3_um_filter_49_7]|nr:MAG: isomerase/hydrolase [Acidobacteria bacterium CG_4_9_14_3_um_filter_49_7]
MIEKEEQGGVVAKFDNVPCPTVQNLYFIGRNYVEHIEELGNERPTEPLIFTKSLSCVAMSGAKIPYPGHSHSLHFEGEMVFVLREHEDFKKDNAMILAGCGIDFTARDIQSDLKKRGWPWFTAKCFRGSAVLSSKFISIPMDSLPRLAVETWINGEKRQHGLYTKKLFPVPILTEYLSKLVDIGENDVLFTGTPAGVGEVAPGDNIEVRLLVDDEVQIQVQCEVE